MSEKALLLRARQFDEQALAEIYDTLSPGLYRYAMRLLGDACLAEECVGETFSRFLSAMRNEHGPRECLKPYLYRVAHNWITDIYRRKAPQFVSYEPELVVAEGDGPDQEMIEAWERQQVRQALASLTPEQRQVISLRYLEDWEHEEIALAMEKSTGAIKALQHRALVALRLMLNTKEGNDDEG
jgi:RNA polymerase sigma-70 factor (ECF subfamily)